MKREFLQSFRVGDQSLPKEVMDAILDEHSRSIGNLKERLRIAEEGMMAFEGVDVKELQGQVLKLQQDLADREAAHQAELAGIAFDRTLENAITAVRGRNAKAIRALLDVDALMGSENLEADVKSALEVLQKENGYLFDDEVLPPPYAGFGGGGQAPKAHTLVGALRERYRT